jgi:hypothetical protein
LKNLDLVFWSLMLSEGMKQSAGSKSEGSKAEGFLVCNVK